ncbi:hypothetical protein E4185_21700 [Aeromonas media]|uniref:hypothetical protein n=1 Tax=Aeromonas media TaxID=651 RepID=UPI00148B312D|nr:hypothetical protein [Aeromonas media]QJT28386.1 hypothetical protein E4185_21700 [Aeromonas media]
MANKYYGRLSEMNPGDLADGLAMEAEFDAISQGFSKLPTPHTGGQGFDGPVRVGDAVNTDEAVSLGQLNAAIGEAVLLPIATYGNLAAAAWGALPSNTYLLFGTGAQLSNTPYTLVAGSTYYLQVRHVIGGAGVSIYHDQLSLASTDDASNIDLRRLFVRTGSTFANANAGGWAGFTLKKAALTALESLVPAAGRFAYYTGGNAASLAELTAFARSLLDDADATAARDTLGAAYRNDAAVTTDLDSIIVTGFHAIDGSNANWAWPGNGGSLVVSKFGGYVNHIAFKSGDPNGLTATRIYNQATRLWGPWAYTYNRKSIVGAVSQSGGTPTNAIIERGSNANGDYVKFADGTMICWRIYRDTSHTTTAMGAVFQKSIIGVAKPAAFAGDNVESHVALYQTGDTSTVRWTGNSGNGVSTVSWNFHSITTTAVSAISVSFGLIAVGRWF